MVRVWGAAVIAAYLSLAGPAFGQCTEDNINTVIDQLNHGLDLKGKGLSILDFDNVLTISSSEKTGEFVCRMTLVFSDSAIVRGDLSRTFSHGRFIVGFQPLSARKSSVRS